MYYDTFTHTDLTLLGTLLGTYSSSFHSSSFFVASGNGHAEAVEMLIDADPSMEHVCVRRKDGKTALDRAVERKRGECGRLLRAAGAQ